MRATDLTRLRRRLEALALRIKTVEVRSGSVALADYPDGSRPTSLVTIEGGGVAGYGEHVGWTTSEHESFRRHAARLARGTTTLGEWTRVLASLPLYDRAALEAAAIDLALRQNQTTLLELAGVTRQLVRYVVSFSPGDDAVGDARRLGSDGEVELKIDADPAWTATDWRHLTSAARIAVVDFKGSGEPDDHERACEAVPGAWIEDPKPGTRSWSPSLLSRLAADAAVTSHTALESLRPVPAAVNVKAPRVGGVLEAISCLATCESRGLHAYIGGMFETGIGRRQSLVLAAIACPDGPNDIAPLVARSRPPRLEVPSGLAGFAGDPA